MKKIFNDPICFINFNLIFNLFILFPLLIICSVYFNLDSKQPTFFVLLFIIPNIIFLMLHLAYSLSELRSINVLIDKKIDYSNYKNVVPFKHKLYK